MFPVSHSSFLDPKIALIEGDPKVFVFDVVPILFTGRNKYRNHVIGKSVTEDEAKGLERYFHLVVTESEFRRFMTGFASYLDLLQEADRIYVVDKQVKSGITKVGLIPFGKIPKKFLPTQYSYFPRELHEPTIEYSTKLSGGSADDSLANPDDISLIQTEITKFLYKSLHAVRNVMGFEMDAKLTPSTVGSYRINYVVKLTKYREIFGSEDKLLGFINSFTEFCMQHLPSEIDGIMALESQTPTKRFDDLFEKAIALAPVYQIGEEAADRDKAKLRESLRKDVLSVPQILAPVAKAIEKSYRSLELSNNNLPLGIINSDFNQTLNNVMVKLEATTVDDYAKPYQIKVFQLNKKSGMGRADLLIGMQAYNIGFSIQEKDENRSPFIESMANDTFIPIQGVMKYKGGKPDHLTI